MPRFCLLLAVLLPACLTFPAAAAADQLAALEPLIHPWPNGQVISRIDGEAIRFSSASPFTLDDLADPATGEPTHLADGRLFLPQGATPLAPVPGVVLLHGARGVSREREITYAQQFAAMGLAALVVDVFASRRHLATGFTNRLIEITESMVLADAFAAKRALASRPEVDGKRIALIGFSYGGMASLFAAHRQVSDLYRRRFDLQGARLEPFKAHVAFYAPCIARFEDHRATGAPVLMVWGDRDEIIDAARCQAVAEDLREGGAEVAIEVFEGAFHQWDGNLSPPWRAPRGLADCAFTVDRQGHIRGALPGTPFHQVMTNTFTRTIILALCSDSAGYLIGKNSDVRVRSNRVMGRFLAESLR